MPSGVEASHSDSHVEGMIFFPRKTSPYCVLEGLDTVDGADDDEVVAPAHDNGGEAEAGRCYFWVEADDLSEGEVCGLGRRTCGVIGERLVEESASCLDFDHGWRVGVDVINGVLIAMLPGLLSRGPSIVSIVCMYTTKAT